MRTTSPAGLARALVEPVDLELGGVERAVMAEAAALHGGQARGPDLRGVPGDDPPDAGTTRRVEAAQQLPDVHRPVRAAGHARRHRVALRPGRDPEERQDLGRAVGLDVDQDVAPASTTYTCPCE